MERSTFFGTYIVIAYIFIMNLTVMPYSEICFLSFPVLPCMFSNKVSKLVRSSSFLERARGRTEL